MADTQQDQIVEEFCSILDVPTILAILSDFDLTQESQVSLARATLDILKESAEAEESHRIVNATDRLNDLPPGNGRFEEDSQSGSGSRSGNGSSNLTDDTALSQALSILDIEDQLESDYDQKSDENLLGEEFNALDEEGKVSYLANLFPGLTPFTIRWSLKKYKGDINLTLDDIMTQSFLEETGARKLGVEAFTESSPSKTSRRRRNRKGKGHMSDNEVQSPIPESPNQSKWSQGKQDIDFISTRTATPHSQVSSIYYANKTSVRETLLYIIKSQQALHMEGSTDPLLHSNAIDLAHEFPTVDRAAIESIVQITYPSNAYAHDLAKALVYSPKQTTGLAIEIRHAPLMLDHPSPSLKTPASATNSLPLEEATDMVSKYTQQRDIAFQQAKQAYRRGKSDHLMGGAAAYYSQQGRDADASARRAHSAAADAIVAQQTSPTELDLHGLTILDAKRVTRERVTAWWHELGTREGGRPKNGARYQIVTGVGHHSNGRVGKLGPAICKMLIRDGWKVEIQAGRVLVVGVLPAGKR